MKNLNINQSNYVAGANGGKFIYTLPNAFNAKDGDQVAVSLVSMYNSTFNISSAMGNNTISLVFNSATPITQSVVFPDGYYSVSDMNYYIQQVCINNKLYVTNASLQNVYFFELVVNGPLYAVQYNGYALPTSAQATTLGYTQPSGATWSYPASASTCQITIPTTTFGNLIGFATGTFPSAITTAQQSVISTTTPTVSPISCYIMTCNLINSPYSTPTNILYSVPITASFGNLIISTPSQLIWNDIAQGSYGTIEINFFDQLNRPLLLRDTDLVITLAVKNKFTD